MKRYLAITAVMTLLGSSAEAQPAAPPDTSPHKVQFVDVDPVPFTYALQRFADQPVVRAQAPRPFQQLQRSSAVTGHLLS